MFKTHCFGIKSATLFGLSLKSRGTMLLTNAVLINWTPREITPDRALLIRADRIIEIGQSSDMIERYPAEERHDLRGRYVLPGNICAHTHFYSAFSRGLAIPGDAPRDFPDILRKLWWPLDQALDRESVRLSALLSLVDAVKHGTTTLFDHHSSPNFITGSLDVIADAVEKAGLRAVLCYEVTDRNGAAKCDAAIDENIRFMTESRTSGKRPTLAATLGLHASMTLSPETLRRCADIADTFHIHVAEHEADEQDSRNRYGVSVVERLLRAGLGGSRTIMAHAVHIDDAELALLTEPGTHAAGTWITHQPRSNMNNGVGAMRFDDLLSKGANVCLGNDGFSNDMWAEWKAAYLLHKVIQRDPRAANGDLIARVAVTNNARLAQVFFRSRRSGCSFPVPALI